MDTYSKDKQTNEKEQYQNKMSKNGIGIKNKSSQNDIKLLIKGLSDNNGLIRRNHSKALAQAGKDALPALIKTLLNSKKVIDDRENLQ